VGGGRVAEIRHGKRHVLLLLLLVLLVLLLLLMLLRRNWEAVEEVMSTCGGGRIHWDQRRMWLCVVVDRVNRQWDRCTVYCVLPVLPVLFVLSCAVRRGLLQRARDYYNDRWWW
jgi:hypothetical protein